MNSPPRLALSYMLSCILSAVEGEVEALSKWHMVTLPSPNARTTCMSITKKRGEGNTLPEEETAK
jgi:hypothetical protein